MSAQVSVLSQQENLSRRLWGGWEETITSALLSKGGERGRRKEDLAKQRQKAEWIRATCQWSRFGILPLFMKQESWRYTI